MRSNRGLQIAVALLLIGTLPASAEVTKASRKCRASIAKQAKVSIAKGLKSLDGCHGKRDKGKSSADCNAVDLSALQSKFASKIGKVCKGGDPVLLNYPGDNPGSAVPDAIEAALAASGAAVQGAPNLAGDKAKAKCHGAIGKGRSAVVSGVVGGATRCQASIDKTASELGNLAASCVVTAGGAGGKASQKISKACGSTTGVNVGSCDPLPGCVVSAGEETGRIVAQAIYGEVTVCGNGVREGDEECDDGNTADADACTHECKNAACGDKIVSAGEECDDGNNINTDACTRVCSGPDNTNCVCRAARCGDGFVQDGEQCDDGNDTLNDGCGNCQVEPTACTKDVGVAVTVSVDWDEISRNLRGVEFNLGYPGLVAIPGHGEETSVQDRILDAAFICNDPPACLDKTPAGFLWTGNDSDQNSDGTDDRLRVVYGALVNVPEGPIVKIHFDCQSGGFLQAANFTCAVTAATDPDGVEIPGQETCAVSLSVPTP